MRTNEFQMICHQIINLMSPMSEDQVREVIRRAQNLAILKGRHANAKATTTKKDD